MRFLVTGGAGFIGSHLVEALVAKGATKVYVIDDFSAPVMSKLDAPGVEYWGGDVSHTSFHEEVDFCYSLASPVAVSAFLGDPRKTIETNVGSAGLCARLCDAFGAGMLFVSSCDGYGQQYPSVLSEDMPGHFRPELPRFCYGIAKQAGEAITFDVARRRGNAYVVRLFKTYGPRLGLDGRMAAVMIHNAVRGEPIPVYDGSQVTTACYVSDSVDALVAFADRLPVYVGPVNVGSPNPITVLGFAQLVVKTLNSTSRIDVLPVPDDRPNDPSRRIPDIALARVLLDWEPKVSWEDGIRLTAESHARTPAPLG